MDIRITPRKLRGTVTVPPSKSVAHRMIIAAALADGVSTIGSLCPSADILATMDCMRALGAGVDFKGDTTVIEGIKEIPDKAVLDCHESGSTLRFLIPVACALGARSEFLGSAKLPQRPITPFTDEFPGHGIAFDFSKAPSGCTLPCSVSGKLTPGRFEIDGGLSSQFITGLMLSLPLLDGDSEIILTSHLNSKPYVDITLGVLRDFGCVVSETDNGYFVKGNQRLTPFSGSVEGDYSQAAFFRTANSLGSELEILGLNGNSLQGDRKITEICDSFDKSGGAPFELDCSDIPDLVPVLTVLASFCKGTSRLTNVARLRFKESDRLSVTAECLNAIGGKVTVHEDSLEIEGVSELHGGEIDGHNDHRIPMSMAVAATRCASPLVIRGADCVKKSFPNFFEVYGQIGGEVIIL
ncbi:MAG: 3-phosphoshikimate 1-carboxyvinyltransferase [Lachnospiraceae bacterium]|nr:3-phosphoshikimate 1-carboxyvinyltransferase [Ruminococcus sp.]MCM1275627.1 3-phosphoshikimate 1-carboxyvinyltransferase [Lachnospiraceae bacterium]